MKEEQKKHPDIVLEIVDLIRLVVFVYLLSYCIQTFVIRPEVVIGRSMYPTLKEEEHVMSNVFTSMAFGIDRFDVVILVEPDSQEQWVKRVIGLPNDTVEYKEGKLYINGVYMEESFLDRDYIASIGKTEATFTEDFSYRTLGEDEYFVMGDNRPESLDSRMRGPFKRSEIIAKDAYVFWPINEMRMVTNGSK